MQKIFATFLFIISFANFGAAQAETQLNKPQNKLEKIQHIIVISLENHSFDNLFGHFPGADSINTAGELAIQKDLNGKPYETLPVVMDTNKEPPVTDTRFPSNLANQPFPIEQYVPLNQETGDLVHRFYQQKQQINGGKMDQFAAISDAGGLVMGYYDGSKLGLWKYAQEYTLADHFFHAAFGGSFLNHFWMICACTPSFEGAPQDIIIKLDKNGHPLNDGAVTEDGYAVNTLLSVNPPHPTKALNTKKMLPQQTLPTIGDRLSEKNISWAWYAGGWDDAVSGKPAENFQFHHQPFAYFKQFAEGSEARSKHLKDENDLLTDLKADTLPSVVFYKPLGEFNLHPGYADVASGDGHIMKILDAIEKSPAWKSSVVVITFDENGGYWDHVAPPLVDRWGPGMRVPTIIISPFARKRFIDHAYYDTTSILKMIETRFDLKPLGPRDKKANDLTATLVLE